MTARTTFIGGIVAIVVVATGCDGSSTPTIRPSQFAPSPASASATVVAPSASSAGAAMSAAWIGPKAKAVIKTTSLELAAKAVGIASVAFKIEAADGSFAGCRSTKPANGIWTCTIDLLDKGIVPGALIASFDVTDLASNTIHALAPERALSYQVAPPRPTTTFTASAGPGDGDTGGGTEIDKITWTSPPGYATEFRLYGLIGCLNQSPQTDGKPCLVAGMSLPAGGLELIRKAGGQSRSMTLTTQYTADDSCGLAFWCGTYGALVLSAYNAYGHSKFAIVASQTVCWECFGP
ncbi:MAG: hypothetical protein ABIZ72_02870 [Candidatus Limnocylindrales bacterium]